MQVESETLTTLVVHEWNVSSLLEFLSFDMRRERHNSYYADCSYIVLQSTPSWTARPRVKSQLTDPINGHPVAPSWTSLTQSQISTNWPQPIASGHDVIHTPVSFPIWGFYYDICDCYILCTQVWTVVNVCTCTKPNSSKSNQTEW